MKKWLLAILFGSVLVLGACGGGDDNTGENNDSGTVETTAGEVAYKDSCLGCHGGDLQGGSGPALDKAGATYSAEDIENIIANGKGNMQPQTGVSDEDRAEIAGWLAEKK